LCAHQVKVLNVANESKHTHTGREREKERDLY
jgi:hypothetical protein